MVEELEQASEEPSTRKGILGTALKDMEGTTYQKIYRKREETPKVSPNRFHFLTLNFLTGRCWRSVFEEKIEK